MGTYENEDGENMGEKKNNIIQMKTPTHNTELVPSSV